MITLMICILIFLAIFLFPFTLSRYVQIRDDIEYSLMVRNDNVKTPRYFVLSFKSMLTKAMENVSRDTTSRETEEIQLSKKEKLIVWDGKRNIGYNVDKVCYVVEPVILHKNGVNFNKEIYAKENIEFAEKTNLRAVAGDKTVVIGENSSVARWADAVQLAVLKKKSKINANLTSANRVVIEPGCTFKRAYAPVIEVRTYVQVIDVTPFDTVINKEAPVYMRIERDIREIDAESECKSTVITKHNLLVRSAAVVYGDLKSDQSIHVRANAVVTGNIFADEVVILEKGVRVLGNVFAGADIYIGPDVIIGKVGRDKSAVAVGNLVITEGCKVYGYLSAEKSARSVAKDDFDEEVLKGAKVDLHQTKTIAVKQRHNFDYMECHFFGDHCIKFDDLEEFEAIDYYAFRDNDKLKSIIIPDGATEIRTAMFYDCDALETIYIPDSVEKIGGYAFYSCDKLKNVVIGENSNLSVIEEYAFSECVALEKLSFIRLKKIEQAAFRNCLSLKNIEIRDVDILPEYENNAFQGCIGFTAKDFRAMLLKKKDSLLG